MTYDLSCYDNSSNIYNVAKCSSDVSGGLFFPLVVMFAGFLILFIAFKMRYDVVVSLIASSFIISVIGIIGWSLGFVVLQILFIPIFLLIGSLIAYMLE